MAASVQCMNAVSGSLIDFAWNHIFFYDNTGTQLFVYRCNSIGYADMFPNAPWSVAQLDPLMIVGAIGGGFFSLLPLWAVIWGGRKLLDAIGK